MHVHVRVVNPYPDPFPIYSSTNRQLTGKPKKQTAHYRSVIPEDAVMKRTEDGWRKNDRGNEHLNCQGPLC